MSLNIPLHSYRLNWGCIPKLVLGDMEENVHHEMDCLIYHDNYLYNNIPKFHVSVIVVIFSFCRVSQNHVLWALSRVFTIRDKSDSCDFLYE